MDRVLRLAYAPVPANAPLFAADIVVAAKNLSQVDLDYTPASLVAVDGILQEMRHDGLTSATMGETLFAFGCYVGEVLARALGLRWAARAPIATNDRDAAGPPIVLAFDEGGFADPIATTFLRVDEERGTDLATFFVNVRGRGADVERLLEETDLANVLPRLMLPTAFDGERARLARRPVDAIGLYSVYVVDAADFVTFITEDCLAASGIDVEELHARALANLEARAPGSVAWAVRGALEEHGINVLKTGDSYDAARLLLLPSVLREGESAVAVLPDRDTFSVMGPIPLDARIDWIERVSKLAHDPDHPLLDHPIVVTPTGFARMSLF